MTKMTMKLADSLGAALSKEQQYQPAEVVYQHLAPTLAARTPFRYLERIGAPLGELPLSKTQPLFDQIAKHKTEGGWVVIAGALNTSLATAFEPAFKLAHHYTCLADIWYACDIFGERVPGPALRINFDRALSLLLPWREDPNPWIRRMTGVAVHFWAKRAKGASGTRKQAAALLAFLTPMFEEWHMDAVKGVGWGLKTLGRFYPKLAAAWLEDQIQVKNRKHRSLMVKKAITYLPTDLKESVVSKK